MSHSLRSSPPFPPPLPRLCLYEAANSSSSSSEPVRPAVWYAFLCRCSERGFHLPNTWPRKKDNFKCCVYRYSEYYFPCFLHNRGGFLLFVIVEMLTFLIKTRGLIHKTELQPLFAPNTANSLPPLPALPQPVTHKAHSAYNMTAYRHPSGLADGSKIDKPCRHRNSRENKRSEAL